MVPNASARGPSSGAAGRTAVAAGAGFPVPANVVMIREARSTTRTRWSWTSAKARPWLSSTMSFGSCNCPGRWTAVASIP